MAGKEHEKERTRGGSGPLIFLAAAVVMLLMTLYVLSVGPVTWLVERSYIDGNSQLLHAVYAPLALVAMYCPPLEWALDGYMEWFR
jgi:hypothetical protein